MERWLGRVALVTGASSGIGEAVTRKLVEHGMKVVACARRSDKLKSLADELNASKSEPHVFPMTCDVTEEEQVLTMFKEIRNRFERLDLCLNNAGCYGGGSLLDGDTSSWKQVLMVNVLGLSICTREAVKLMLEKNIDDGQIIHLNSMSGHRITPNNAFYASSKFAVTGLTEGLRVELARRKSRIRVACISPGMVKTDLFSSAFDEDQLKDLFEKNPVLEAEDIANLVLNVLQTPPHVQVHDILVRPTTQLV